MRTTIVALTLLAAVGCGGAGSGEQCVPPADLAVEGDMPPNTAVVLQVAAERCAYPLVGRVAFTALPDGLQGTCARNWECGLDAEVDRGWCRDAVETWSCALAHEIGHYCLHTHDDAEAEAWGKEVGLEARARITTP